MSGPYCETCKFYRPTIFGDSAMGVCTDYTKAIINRCGDRVGVEPSVHISYGCANHKTYEEGR